MEYTGLHMKSRSYLLYAEDDPDDVLFLCDMLSFTDKEHPVYTVPDGLEVIRFLENIPPGDAYPSLIVLDIGMPRLDGIELLQLLKTDDKYRMIPVLIFSNYASENHRRTCHELDTEIITKPVYYKSWEKVISKMQSYFDE